MTTIYDIAKKVGCAPSSVSKYITKHGYVSQALGEKIAQAMVDLDYHYNGLARNLSNGTNNRIGVMVPFLSHPYFQQLITAVSMAATQSGKEVVIMPTVYDPAKEKRYLEELEHNLVGSLIITSHALPTATCAAYRKFGPIVFCKDANDAPGSCIITNREQVYRCFHQTTEARQDTHWTAVHPDGKGKSHHCRNVECLSSYLQDRAAEGIGPVRGTHV